MVISTLMQCGLQLLCAGRLCTGPLCARTFRPLCAGRLGTRSKKKIFLTFFQEFFSNSFSKNFEKIL